MSLPADICAQRDRTLIIAKPWRTFDWRCRTERPDTHSACGQTMKIWVVAKAQDALSATCPFCEVAHHKDGVIAVEQRKSVLILLDARLIVIDLPGAESDWSADDSKKLANQIEGNLAFTSGTTIGSVR